MTKRERTEYEADLNAACGREEENARRLEGVGITPLRKGVFNGYADSPKSVLAGLTAKAGNHGEV